MAALPENDRITGPYLADPGQTDFPADFPLIRAAGLRVRVQSVGLPDVILTPPDVSAIDVVADGFTARLAVALSGGQTVFVYSQLPAARPRAHTPGGATRTDTLESDAMELQAQLQEARRDLGQAVLVGPGQTPPSPEDLAALAGGIGGVVEQAVLAGEAAGQAAGAAAAVAAAEEAVGDRLVRTGVNADPTLAENIPVTRTAVGAVPRSIAGKLRETALSINDFSAASDPGAQFSAAQVAAGDRGRVVNIPRNTYALSFDLGGWNNWDLEGELTLTGSGAAKGLPGNIFQRSGVRNPDGSVPPGNPFYFGPHNKGGITTFQAITQRVSPLDVSTVVGYSSFGHAGVTAFTRSLDNPNPGYDEGGTAIFAVALNDRVSPKKGMYAAYLDAIRMPGAGITHCVEIDAINRGSVVPIHPSGLFGGDISTGLWVASGGASPGSTTATAAMTILANGAQWDKGIVHHELAYPTDVAQAMALYHRSGWYTQAGAMVAWDRSDDCRRFSVSDSPTTGPAVNLARARSTGDTASGDFVGGVNAVTVSGGVDTRRGGLLWKRAPSSGTEVALTGHNSGAFEFGLVVARGGENSIDPTSPNIVALGGVNPWANIYSQNALTVTSDARAKLDLGAPEPALLRAAAAVPIKTFQMLEAIALKGEDQARIHPGVIAQEVQAAFEAEGLDPWRYGVLCADPWLETYEAVETVEEPLFKTVVEEVVEHTIDAFGGAIQTTRMEERQVEDWNVLPVFDADGEPVLARKASDAYALVLDPDGRENLIIAGEMIRARRVAVEPGMVEGVDNVLRIRPAEAEVQATHRVRATRLVEQTVTQSRPRLDADGRPMQRLSVRYEALILLKLAAMAAGIVAPGSA